MWIIDIQRAYVGGSISREEARRRLREHGRNPDGSALDDDQVEDLLDSAEEDVRLRVEVEEGIGRQATFDARLEEMFRRSGVRPSGVTRSVLGGAFAPLEAEFRLRKGLGDFQDREGAFGSFLPGRIRPTPEVLRHLLSRAAGLFGPDAFASPEVGDDPDPRRRQQQTFLDQLTKDDGSGQARQISLALQGVIGTLPRSMRRAYAEFFNRKVDQWRLENPEGNFLPDFVSKGFNL